MVKRILTTLAATSLAAGLWNHDWHLIIASGCVATIWPLIRVDIENVAHDKLVDQLWQDD